MQNDFTDQMTRISRQAFDAATANLSARDAAQALLTGVRLRSFGEILHQYVPEDQARARLVEGLCANDPARKRDSVAKKVRDWLAGKYQPTAREDLLELCFVLGLTAEEADAFLAAAGEEGLHWRDPRELVYAYALGRRMGYPEARALYERVKPQAAGNQEKTAMTALVHSEAAALDSEDALRQYLAQAADRLGALHNSAYRQFMALLRILETPDSAADLSEGSYTTREIVQKYLDKKLPPLNQGKRMDEKHRGILAGWPDEITLSRMKNRVIDVSRKVLMLLFLATDGGDGPEEDWPDADWEDWDEDLEPTPPDEQAEADEAFRSSYIRMNQMLASCGYRMLDPRSPFDWIAIYCMRVDTESESMEGLNERLAGVLDILFAAAEEKIPST